ncbi:MAG TPA: HAD-IB family hydrolase [Actinomycetota bacterium]|nr:HAD-IB family hydrolase [Actinomycetota bacterium]
MTEAAFFDLDRTLIPGSSLFPIAREMFRRGYFTTGDIARFTLDQAAYRLFATEDPGRIRRARQGALDGIRERSREEVLELGRDLVRLELLPRMYPQALELVARHQRHGRQVYVCSAAPEDLLQLFAADLGLDGVLGTRALVDDDGRYTGELDGEPCHGEEKARRVLDVADEQHLDLEGSYAYSDSVNDVPLFEVVGNPVATNPDRHLLQEARRRGWPVLDFRAGRRRALVASVAGASAAATGVAAYVTGYLVGRARTRAAAA